MRIKLDENIDWRVAGLLSAAGHDADSAADEGLLSQPDVRIAEAAKNEGRTLFTLDLDFTDARKFPPGRHPGIVVFRPGRLSIGVIRQMILDFASGPDTGRVEGAITIVEPGRTRTRHPEPSDDPGDDEADPRPEQTRGEARRNKDQP